MLNAWPQNSWSGHGCPIRLCTSRFPVLKIKARDNLLLVLYL